MYSGVNLDIDKYIKIHRFIIIYKDISKHIN